MTYQSLKALAEAGEFDEVIQASAKHLNDDPQDAVLLYMAARAMSEKGWPGMAQPLALKSASMAPHLWEAWNLLGKTQSDTWHLDEAEDSFRRALQIGASKYPAPLSNMAMTKYLRGKTLDAIELAKKVLHLDPDCQNTYNNLGMFLLALKQWEGWKYYERGLGHHHSRRERIYGSEPRWDGTKGQTVVAYGEQGIGDEISFAMSLPDLIRDSKKVIVECDHRLEGLFKRSFPEADVYGTRFRECDWLGRYGIDGRVAFGSLQKFYRTSDASFSGKPYLVADPERRKQWRALLQDLPGLKVGIAWTGGTAINGRNLRSLTLNDLVPILSLPASFVSLEYRDPTAALEGFREATQVTIHEWGRATRTLDYDDTAALVAELDLVISVTTSVIHLSGALGVPTLILTPKNPMWRYGREGDRMPHYESVKLFRQKTDWTYPINCIAEDLSARIRSSQVLPNRATRRMAERSSKHSKSTGRRT